MCTKIFRAISNSAISNDDFLEVSKCPRAFLASHDEIFGQSKMADLRLRNVCARDCTYAYARLYYVIPPYKPEPEMASLFL